MIHVSLTDELQREAQRRADAMPVLKNSQRGAEANTVGCLGELVVEHVLQQNGVPFDREHKTTHDLAFPDGRTMEIKTKDRTVVPQPFYDCTLPAYNIEHQQANMFTFVSLYRPSKDLKGKAENYTDAYVLGVIGKSKFRRDAKYWEKGSVDPSNETKFWTACYNVYVNQLMDFEEAINRWLINYA
jgi:hypothetical protein